MKYNNIVEQQRLHNAISFEFLIGFLGLIKGTCNIWVGKAI